MIYPKPCKKCQYTEKIQNIVFKVFMHLLRHLIIYTSFFRVLAITGDCSDFGQIWVPPPQKASLSILVCDLT